MGRRQWGEGFTGTTIKDTYIKSRGGWKQGGEVGLEVGGVEDGEKMQTPVIE